MSTTMQLSDLMVAVRQRADMLPSGYTPALTGSTLFVTDPELISYVNQSYFGLYDLLVATFGADYFLKSYQLTTDGTNQLFALPADFYKMKGVDLQLNAGQNAWVTVPPFNFVERNKYSLPNALQFYGRTNLRYRIEGSNLWLAPMPAGGQTVQIWYVPRMTTLAALSDTLDGVSGWTEYVIVDAAIKCVQKEEGDVSVLMAEKAELVRRIETMAETRDVGSAPTVSDAQSTHSYGPWDGGEWGDT